MRTLLLLLLLLPCSLYSQVKILMPVVAKDAAGKPVTDLKVSDFQVSGLKDVRIDSLQLVVPQTVSRDNPEVPIVVLYDAVNIYSDNLNVDVQLLREFLGEVAKRRLPVTFLINTEAGLHLVYSARTSPEILTAALAASASPKIMTDDPQVEQQLKNLGLLKTVAPTNRTRPNGSIDQMNSLIGFAHLVQQSQGRKAIIWISKLSPVPETDVPAYWASPQSYGKSLLPMYEATVEELNAAHVSVYPLLWSNANPRDYGGLWDMWTGLRQRASSTGGVPLRLGEQVSILGAVQAALADFGPYYMLVVSAPTPKELDWIPVKIKVNRPGVTVRAAPGFLGLKPVKVSKGSAQP